MDKVQKTDFTDYRTHLILLYLGLIALTVLGKKYKIYNHNDREVEADGWDMSCNGSVPVQWMRLRLTAGTCLAMDQSPYNG
jgi:hypothetical protein